ncbi:MAG: hypothetical protein KAX28_01725 [Candidatus Marinimicrobia bacterium]|nr:hypothetical protein [Candidatus Neomarinimicrobiota bacterium]
MKVVFSIINEVEKTIGELRFRLVLDKNDWVLVNQFPPEYFTVTHKVEKGYVIEFSKPFKEKEPTTTWFHLKCHWGKEPPLHPIEKEGKVVEWETDEFRIKKRAIDIEPLAELLLVFTTEIKRIMGKYKKLVQEGDTSCWEKEVKIEY